MNNYVAKHSVRINRPAVHKSIKDYRRININLTECQEYLDQLDLEYQKYLDNLENESTSNEPYNKF
jgi:hypothetical protein